VDVYGHPWALDTPVIRASTPRTCKLGCDASGSSECSELGLATSSWFSYLSFLETIFLTIRIFRILYSRKLAVYLTFEAFLDKRTTRFPQALHDYLRSPSLPNLVPLPFPKTRKIGTIRTSYRLRNLAIHRGYPILSSSHQDLRASSEFRSSRTLVQDLEHHPRAPVPAIKITSRSGPIVPTTATPRARLAPPFTFKPPMLPLFLCAHLFDFKYMPPPLPITGGKGALIQRIH